MNARRSIVAAAILVLIFTSFASAQVPGLINYQGRLLDGTNLVSDSVELSLQLYNDPNTGDLVYEDSNSVNVVDGLYATFIGDDPTAGSGTLANALTNPAVYIQVRVNGTALSPRQQMASVAYAQTSGGVTNGAILTRMLNDNAVSGDKLSDNAITSAKIADGSVSNEDIAANAVTSDKIENSAVTQNNLSDTVLSNTFWRLGGNAGTTPGTHFVGTLDDNSFDIRVNNQRALRILPHAESPNIIGGHEDNSMNPSVKGATIAGGGHAGAPNEVNLAGHYSFIGGGEGNQIGQDFYSTTHSTIGGGLSNTTCSIMTTVAGGEGNYARSVYATVGGGFHNFACGYAAWVGGGSQNSATSKYATVGGGILNKASATNATVAGGRWNTASGNNATVSGGTGNDATAAGSTVSGGAANDATAAGSTVSGGNNNRATNNNATVGGGTNNFASGYISTINGGRGNRARGNFSVVGGGARNMATGPGATVGGGFLNEASGNSSFIGGGTNNTASGRTAFVGAGRNNQALGSRSVIGGGYNNVIEDSGIISYSVIGGGYQHLISSNALYATIPGGGDNEVDGDFSFAAGRRAKALYNGSFVWADSHNGDFESVTNDQFAIRATNGVWVASSLGERTMQRRADRFSDNNIIAWARIPSSGVIDMTYSFGIESVTNSATGIYEIDIDVTLDSYLSLIPLASVEVDGIPLNAANARLIYVDQTTGANSFQVYITDGNYTANNCDFVFMVTGR